MKKRVKIQEDEEQECGREGSEINDQDSRTRKISIWRHKDKARVGKHKNREPPRSKIMNSGATKAMMMSLTLFLRLLVTPLAKTNLTVGGENMISF